MSVLTGFLGAGKTTVLRALLAAERFGDTAVLVNEFGEIGIDQLLVDTISPDVVLLDSGCICCRIRGELRDALVGLLERRDRGELPAFRRIVIETTGIAEPGPVVATLAADPVLSRRTSIGAIVTVVDALACAVGRVRRREWLEQVAAADTLLLAKVDLVGPEAIVVLREELARCAPTTAALDWRAGPDCLQEAFDASRSRQSPPTPLPTPQAPPLASRTPTPVSARDGAHGRDVRSLVLELDARIDWTAFGVWLSSLLHAHGDRVLRVKGLVDVGAAGPVLLNAVQHTVYPPEHLDTWPEGAGSRLVFIVDGIEPGVLETSFRRHVPGIAASAPVPAPAGDDSSELERADAP